MAVDTVYVFRDRDRFVVAMVKNLDTPASNGYFIAEELF